MADPIPTLRGGSGGIPIDLEDLTAGNYQGRIFNGADDGFGEDFPLVQATVTSILPWGWSVQWSSGVSALTHNNGNVDSNDFAPSAGLAIIDETGSVIATASWTGTPFTLGPHTHSDASSSFSGSLNVRVYVDEYAIIDYLDSTEAVYYPDPSDPSALPYPVTGGNAMPDSIPARKIQLFVIPRSGQTVTVTASVNSASTSASFVWGDGTPWYHGFSHVIEVAAVGATGTGTATPKVSGVTLYAQAHHHATAGHATYAADGSLTVTQNNPYGDLDTAIMKANAEIPTSYRYNASFVGADGVPWTHPLTVSTPVDSFSVTGSGTHDVSLKSWVVQDYLGSSLVHTDGVTDEKGYMTAAIGQSSLRDSHLDTRDWRLQIKTYRQPGLTIAHAASTTILAAGAEGWSGGTAGGIGYRATSGSATWAGDALLWNGYRYAEINLKAPTGTVATITLSNQDIAKSYKVTTTSSGAAYLRFDTCSPSNAPAIDDGVWKRDTPYPTRPQPTHFDSPINAEPDDQIDYLDGIVEPPLSGEAPDASLQTWFSGANDVTSISVSFALPSGSSDVPEIGAIRLVRVSEPKLTLSEGFCGQGKILQDGFDCIRLWQLTASGGRTTETGSVWGSPFCYLVVDGRLVYALPGNAYRQFVVGGYEIGYDTVAQLAANLNHLPGWTCTVSTAAANFYGLSASTAFANCLGGEGSDHDGTTWTHRVDKALGAVPIQDQYDWVAAWPGCGDVWQWGVGSIGDPCILAVAKILGVRSQGFVLQGDGSANPGAPVTPGLDVWNERTDNLTGGGTTQVRFGKGTSQADGSYSTDVTDGPVGKPALPYTYDGLEYGDETGTTTLQQDPKPSETSRFRARWIKRTTFRAIVDNGTVRLSVDDVDGFFLELTSTSEVKAFVFRISGQTFNGTVATGKNGAPWNRRDGTLCAAYAREGAIYAKYSYNHGQTWVEEEMVAPGTLCDADQDPITGWDGMPIWNAGDWHLWLKKRMADSSDEAWEDRGLIVTAPEKAAGFRFSRTDEGAAVFSYSDGTDTKRKATYNYGQTWEDLTI